MYKPLLLAPFTVPPCFAKINCKFTDEQLKNYQARIDGFHSDVIKGASLRASSPIWASEASLARTRE